MLGKVEQHRAIWSVDKASVKVQHESQRNMGLREEEVIAISRVFIEALRIVEELLVDAELFLFVALDVGL